MEEYDGAIGIVFRRDEPNKYLLIHNKRTGNITFPAGAREEEDTSSDVTVKREIYEETGLIPEDYILTKTDMVHEFVYNKKKVDRTGNKSKQIIYLIETKKSSCVFSVGMLVPIDMVNTGAEGATIKDILLKVNVQEFTWLYHPYVFMDEFVPLTDISP